MRLHPKRRASMDHRPGPNIARAAPAAPNNSQSHRSPGSTTILQISIRATDVPTIGVHKPATSRIPVAIESTASMETFIGGALASREPARKISAEPTTKRIRSKPAPGQPPANVEYKRRNNTTSKRYSLGGCERRSTPQEGLELSPFRVNRIFGNRSLWFVRITAR
jgi:hypothetical protein